VEMAPNAAPVVRTVAEVVEARAVETVFVLVTDRHLVKRAIESFPRGDALTTTIHARPTILTLVPVTTPKELFGARGASPARSAEALPVHAHAVAGTVVHLSVEWVPPLGASVIDFAAVTNPSGLAGTHARHWVAVGVRVVGAPMPTHTDITSSPHPPRVTDACAVQTRVTSPTVVRALRRGTVPTTPSRIARAHASVVVAGPFPRTVVKTQLFVAIWPIEVRVAVAIARVSITHAVARAISRTKHE
jgi:hypothetical protein